jgi:crossover junction endodeoxyribonuclease RuvC
VSARVIGLDLSLTSTGVAEITTDDHGVTDHRTWTIESNGRAHPTWEQRAARLDRLVDRIVGDVLDLDDGLQTAGVDVALIEGHVTGAPGDPHDRSGLWWLVYRELRAYGVPIGVFAPSTRMKYATGNGRASKLQVVSAMSRRWPLDMIANDDEWDALVGAELAAHRVGLPMPHTLTKEQRACLGAVTWPDRMPAVTW